MNNQNLEAGHKALTGIRTAATGVMGYLSMINDGDFPPEEIPKIVTDLLREIPIIKSRINELQKLIQPTTNNSPETLIHKICPGMNNRLDQLGEMLGNARQVSASKTWENELIISQQLIRNINYVLLQFKEMRSKFSNNIKSNEAMNEEKTRKKI